MSTRHTTAVQLEAELESTIREYVAGTLTLEQARGVIRRRSSAVSKWCDKYAEEVGRDQADHLERIIRSRLLRYVEVLGAEDRGYRHGRFRSVRAIPEAHNEYPVSVATLA